MNDVLHSRPMTRERVTSTRLHENCEHCLKAAVRARYHLKSDPSYASAAVTLHAVQILDDASTITEHTATAQRNEVTITPSRSTPAGATQGDGV